MAKFKRTFSVLALTLLTSMLLPPSTLAAGGDLYLSDDNVYFSTNYFVENVPVMIYATAGNNANEDLLGTIQFQNNTNGTQISSDQPISALADSSDTVFVSWTPSAGTQQISVTVYPWDTTGDDPGNNTIYKTITADYDTDGDGVGNNDDTDDDNDGYPDSEDDFPLNSNEWEDTDGDGIGNNSDTDDDNDGVLDQDDAMPLDYKETLDTDGDGIGNNADTDDDGDGIKDNDEKVTDPLNKDSDEDGYSDSEDDFPMDGEEWSDYDNDGIGDNADPDDDNDGLPDDEDEYDKNKGPVIEINKGSPIHFTGQTITIDASSSYDEDGEVKKFAWVEGDETLSVNDTYQMTYLESGEKNIELTITDNQGETRTTTINIRVYSKRFLIFLGLLIIILLCLAFYIIYRYSPRAKQVKSVKKSTKPKKKTIQKKATKKKSTKKAN